MIKALQIIACKTITVLIKAIVSASLLSPTFSPRAFLHNFQNFFIFVYNYDKHIEIAHIKAIKDFDPDTRLSQINDVSNLLPLCPNCHWEFDHTSEQQGNRTH